MTARGGYAPSKGAQIEQAVAFGRSLDWILEHLACEPTDVDAALARMDAAASHDNARDLFATTPALVRQPAGPLPVGREALAEAARQEAARVYGATVPESPLQPRQTQAQLDEVAYLAAVARVAATRRTDRGHLRVVTRLAS